MNCPTSSGHPESGHPPESSADSAKGMNRTRPVRCAGLSEYAVSLIGRSGLPGMDRILPRLRFRRIPRHGNVPAAHGGDDGERDGETQCAAAFHGRTLLSSVSRGRSELPWLMSSCAGRSNTLPDTHQPYNFTFGDRSRESSPVSVDGRFFRPWAITSLLSHSNRLPDSF